MGLSAVQDVETRFNPFAEDQGEVRAGQHDRFTSAASGQRHSGSHEDLTVCGRRNPCSGHRHVGFVNLHQVIHRSDDFHPIENTVEARFHDHTGSKQTDSFQAAPIHFELDHVQQVDHGNRRHRFESVDAEMSGNRCDGNLGDPCALQSVGQAEIDIDLGLDVSFGLIPQQAWRVRVSHRQLKILAGTRCRSDQVSIVVVSRCGANADNQSDMHVHVPGRSSLRADGSSILHGAETAQNPDLPARSPASRSHPKQMDSS